MSQKSEKIHCWIAQCADFLIILHLIKEDYTLQKRQHNGSISPQAAHHALFRRAERA